MDSIFSPQSDWDVFIQKTSTQSNETRLSIAISKAYTPTVVIIYEKEVLEVLNETLEYDADKDLLSNVIYLVITTSEKQKNPGIKQAVEDVATVFTGFLSTYLIRSQVYIITAQNKELQLIEIYQICSDYGPEKRFLRNLLKNSSRIENIWQRRANLDLCPFRVAFSTSSVQYNVEDMLNSTIKPNEPSYQSTQNERQTMIIDGMKVFGPAIQFFSILQSKLDFSVQWVQENDYGVFDENQQEWTGAIGMVKRGEVDTYLDDMSITQSRSKAVAFTTAFQSYSYRLYMQKRTPSSSWSTFLKVFNGFYWELIAFTIFALATILFSFSHGEKLLTIDGSIAHCSKVMKFVNAISTTASAFLALDVNFANFPKSRKILVLTICMCGTLNFYVYNAGLTSWLTVQNKK